MVWELLTLAVCGLLVGALGRLVRPGPASMSWPRALLLGLGGALGSGVLTAVVLGQGHATISLLVAVGLAALVVATYRAFRRTRRLPPG
ncbi:hypothetical protein [Actinospica robiniae]|uniref:hypothetical protein n=1 Tax=Actinospica robiniae TaxID=304901 RepID=UPI000421EFEC|nr:hypothetical protein [Actinospica robiniae]